MPEPTPVLSDDALPGRADIVVIGAGIAGISSALELVERGLNVVICDKGLVAGEQSSRNWGWCRQMGRDPRELPLIHLSLSLWRQMRQRLGEDVGFRETGIIYLCKTDEELENRALWVEKYAAHHQLSSQLVSASETKRLSGISSIDWKGGLFTPDDGRAEPQLAVPAMARAAQRLGAKILQRCAVRGLLYQAGRVSGVVTEKGEIACDKVLLAGGIWSRKFCRNCGINLPQLTIINSVMRTAPMTLDIPHALGGLNFALRKRLDGGYTIAHKTLSIAEIVPDSMTLFFDFLDLMRGDIRDLKMRFGKRFFQELAAPKYWTNDDITPFERCRIFNPQPSKALLNEAFQSLCSAIGEFKQAQITERWAGGIDVLPDAVPIISEIDDRQGLYLSTGFSGHGFGIGPGAGRLMAELMCNEAPCVDPAPFRFDRFVKHKVLL